MNLKDILTIGAISILGATTFKSQIDLNQLRSDFESEVTSDKRDSKRLEAKFSRLDRNQREHEGRSNQEFDEYLSERTDIDLNSIRSMVLNTNREIRDAYNSGNQLELSLAIRNYVHWEIRSSNPTESDVYPNFSRSWTSGFKLFEQFHFATHGLAYLYWCQGFAFVNQMVHESLGIPARMVDLYQDSDETAHSTMEVLINGRWIASDSTYNVSYMDADRYLGYEEVRDRCLKGEYTTVTSDGYPVKFCSTFEENQFFPSCEKSKDEFNYLVINPTVIHNGYELEVIPAETFPKDWDREIHLPDGVIWHGTYGFGERNPDDPNGDFNYRSKISEGFLR